MYNVYQTQTDDSAKVELLDRLHNIVLYTDLKLARKHADEQLVLSRKINFKKGIAFSYYNLGGYYKNTGIKDSAKTYF